MTTPSQTLSQPISKPKEVVRPFQRFGDIENPEIDRLSPKTNINPLTLPKFDMLSWLNLVDSAKFISKSTKEVGDSIKELVVIDLLSAQGSINFQKEKPQDPKKVEQQKEASFINQKNNTLQGELAQVRAENESKEDVRAGVAGMSSEQRAKASGLTQLAVTAKDILSNVYTRMFISLKRSWDTYKESQRNKKPVEIAKGRASAMHAAMEGAAGQSGGAMMNLSASGGGAG